MAQPEFIIPDVNPKTTSPEDAIKQLLKLNSGGMMPTEITKILMARGYGHTKLIDALKILREKKVIVYFPHSTDTRSKIIKLKDVDQLAKPDLLLVKIRDDKIKITKEFLIVTKQYTVYNSSTHDEKIFHHFRDDEEPTMNQTFKFTPITKGIKIDDTEFHSNRFIYTLLLPSGESKYLIDFMFHNRNYYQMCFTKNIPEHLIVELKYEKNPKQKPILRTYPENKKIKKLEKLTSNLFRLDTHAIKKQDYKIVWR